MFDDLYYRTLTEGSSTYFNNLVLHLKDYYFAWGGRWLAHGFAGVVLSFDSSLGYAILNTFMLGLVIFLMVQITMHLLIEDEKLARNKPSDKFSNIDLYFFITAFIFLFAKKPMQTMFWTTGSMNYLWMAFFQLLFLYLNRAWLFGDRYLKSIGMTIALILSGFLAGSTNENAGVALLALITVVFYFRKKSEKKIATPQELCVSFGLLAGTVMLIIAPGNGARKAMIQAGGQATGFGQKLNWFVESLMVFFGRMDGVSLLAVVLFIYLLFKAKKSNPPLIQNQNYLKLWAMFSAGCLAFLGHNGNFYGRSSFNISLFFIIIATFLVFTFLSQSTLGAKKHQDLLKKFKIFLAITMTAKLGFAVWNIVQFNRHYQTRHQEIQIEVAKGQKNIVTYNFRHSQVFDLEDITADVKNPVNVIFAEHYKVSSIAAPVEQKIPWVKRNR